jgi:hypothetical protein
LGVIAFFLETSTTKDDYKKIEIIYERINVVSDSEGGAPAYIIFSKDDGKSFRVLSSVSRYFDESLFYSQIKQGDMLTLTVLKSHYENRTTRIKTLSIAKEDVIFLDFDSAFNRYNRNAFMTSILHLIAFPLSGTLTIAFIVWLLIYNKVYNKGKTGKATEDRLSFKLEEGHLKTIKLPVPIATIFIYISMFLAGIALPLFFLYSFTAFIAMVILCGLITIFNAITFILFFLRKLIINKENKTITYFSFFKRTFKVDQITKVYTIIDDSSEGVNGYYLTLKTASKTIEIRTQSDEQSQLLLQEILALKEPVNDGFFNR